MHLSFLGIQAGSCELFGLSPWMRTNPRELVQQKALYLFFYSQSFRGLVR